MLLPPCSFFLDQVIENGSCLEERIANYGDMITRNFTPTGNYLFDKTCKEHGIEHRLIKPRTPQTNGMVERFNGRIANILKTTNFNSSDQLETALQRYERIYNHHIPQRNLGYVTPIQALKQWQEKRPNLFIKMVYNHTGLDSECRL
jgi:hypothetical protein